MGSLDGLVHLSDIFLGIKQVKKKKREKRKEKKKRREKKKEEGRKKKEKEDKKKKRKKKNKKKKERKKKKEKKGKKKKKKKRRKEKKERKKKEGKKAVRDYKKGDEISAVVLQVDPERERIFFRQLSKLKKTRSIQYLNDTKKGTMLLYCLQPVDAKGVSVQFGR